jgi:hypothetical protein
MTKEAGAAADLRERIRRDRRLAGAVAVVASAPVFALPVWAVAGAIYGAFTSDADGENPFVVLAVVLAILAPVIGLLAMVGVWTWRAVFAALTPPRAQIMWLRRFQAEGPGRFRVSREVDGLSRWGVGALTLQDRDVTLSWEQRRARLAPVFWLAFVPVAAVAGWGFTTMAGPAVNSLMEARMEAWKAAQDLSSPGGVLTAAIGGFVVVIVNAFLLVLGLMLAGLLAFVLVLLLAMVAAALSGPIGQLRGRKRDDFPKLPSLLARIAAGRRPRGAKIVRIRDENWREAVRMCLEGVDAAIIDVSEVTNPIAWEIAQALAAAGPARTVFIAREGAPRPELTPAAEAMIAGAAPGFRLPDVSIIRYPPGAVGRGGAKQFARALREAAVAACGGEAA